MQHLSPTAEHVETARANYARFESLAQRYRDDATLRARLDSDDVSDSLAELGIVLPPDLQVRIVADTPETHHLVLPPDPNIHLSDEELAMVAGGKSAGSAGSISSVSSVACSTIPSTVSTLGSAGTAGTAS